MEQLIIVDQRGRITIGKEYAGKAMRMSKETGMVTLSECEVIDVNSLTPEMKIWLETYWREGAKAAHEADQKELSEA